jgi:hypothetical protein
MPVAIEGEQFPTEVRTAVRSPRWGRRVYRWASLRRFLTVCKKKSSDLQTHSSISWCPMIPQVKRPDVDVLRSAVVRPAGRTAKFSKTTLKAACGREINIPLFENSCVVHSCSKHANCTLPQPETSVALCCVTKLHILEWPFIVSSTRCTCVMIMLFHRLICHTCQVDGLSWQRRKAH